MTGRHARRALALAALAAVWPGTALGAGFSPPETAGGGASATDVDVAAVDGGAVTGWVAGGATAGPVFAAVRAPGGPVRPATLGGGLTPAGQVTELGRTAESVQVASGGGRIALVATTTIASTAPRIDLVTGTVADGLNAFATVSGASTGTDPGDAAVAVDGAGRVLVAWPVAGGLRFAVLGPGGLTPVRTRPLAGELSEFAIAGGPDGFLLVWSREREEAGGDELVTSVEQVAIAPDGTPGSIVPVEEATRTVDPDTLLSTGPAVGAPSLASGGGRAVVAYERQQLVEDEATTEEVVVATGGIGGVGSPTVVSDGGVGATGPLVAVGDQGVAGLTYATDAGVVLESAPAGGGFGGGGVLGAGTGQAAVLADGTVLGVYGTPGAPLQARGAAPGGGLGDPVAVAGDGAAAFAADADGAGHAPIAYATGANGAADIRLLAYDTVAPGLPAPTVPARGDVGEVLRFTAAPTDAWSPVTVRWAFGDGAAATGASVTHAYAAAGTFAARAVAEDAAGNASAPAGRDVRITAAGQPPRNDDPPPVQQTAPVTQPEQPGQTDTTPPTVDGLRLTRTLFRVGPRSSPLAVGAALGRGSTLHWRTSEAGTLRLTVYRLARIAGGRSRCAAAKAPRRARGDGAPRLVGRLRRAVAAGRGSMPFDGRVGRAALSPGRYEVRAVVADAAGNLSRSAIVRFTLC